MSVVIEAWRPVIKGTLRGFLRCRFESGMILDEIAVHVGGDDGRAWCSPPARPMIGADGTALRDPRTGKIKYCGLITFSTAHVRHSWQEQILRALELKHPEVLADATVA